MFTVKAVNSTFPQTLISGALATPTPAAPMLAALAAPMPAAPTELIQYTHISLDMAHALLAIH